MPREYRTQPMRGATRIPQSGSHTDLMEYPRAYTGSYKRLKGRYVPDGLRVLKGSMKFKVHKGYQEFAHGRKQVLTHKK